MTKDSSHFPADPFCGSDSARPKTAHGMLSTLLFYPALSASFIPQGLFVYVHLPEAFSLQSLLPSAAPFPLVSDIISPFNRGPHAWPIQGSHAIFILHDTSEAIVWLFSYHNP